MPRNQELENTARRLNELANEHDAFEASLVGGHRHSFAPGPFIAAAGEGPDGADLILVNMAYVRASARFGDEAFEGNQAAVSVSLMIEHKDEVGDLLGEMQGKGLIVADANIDIKPKVTSKHEGGTEFATIMELNAPAKGKHVRAVLPIPADVVDPEKVRDMVLIARAEGKIAHAHEKVGEIAEVSGEDALFFTVGDALKRAQERIDGAGQFSEVEKMGVIADLTNALKALPSETRADLVRSLLQDQNVALELKAREAEKGGDTPKSPAAGGKFANNLGPRNGMSTDRTES
jgi:hypothetical protein